MGFYEFKEKPRLLKNPNLQNECYTTSEEFNNFAQWLFFGSEGVIADNVRHEQRKIIKYNHLVANMVILHNVEAMTKVIKEIQDEEIEITQEILSALSPYRTHHINRFGDYTLDFEREIRPMTFSTKILS